MIFALTAHLISSSVAAQVTQAAPSKIPEATPYSQHFGAIFDACGDVDGDGCTDVAIGCPQTASTGFVLLFSGKTSKLVGRIDPPATDPHFGRALVLCGDLDGDKLPDLVVLGGGDVIAGVAAASPARLTVVSLRERRCVRSVELDTDIQGAGFAMRRIGDVDGDGKEDLLVMGTKNRPAGKKYGVWDVENDEYGVLSLATGKMLWRTPAHFNILTTEALCVVPDIDGDGFADVAACDADCVCIRSGRTGIKLRELDSKLITSSRVMSLESPGDLNGDGVPELVIGLWSGQAYHSKVLVFSIKDMRVLYNVLYEAECSTLDLSEGLNWGRAIVGVGDVDGDGAPDFVVTTHDVTGTAFFVSGKTGKLLRHAAYQSVDIPDIGWIARRANDLDGDGTPDVLIGKFNPKAMILPEQGVFGYSGKTGNEIFRVMNRAP